MKLFACHCKRVYDSVFHDFFVKTTNVSHALQAVYEVLFQTRVKIFGDVPKHEASTLTIMNHRTRFDWLYLFSYQVRHGSVRRYTISLKNMIKFLPGIGSEHIAWH